MSNMRGPHEGKPSQVEVGKGTAERPRPSQFSRLQRHLTWWHLKDTSLQVAPHLAWASRPRNSPVVQGTDEV